TIKELRKKYKVVVICAEDSVEAYKGLDGVIVVENNYFKSESSNMDLSRISEFASHYGVEHMHKHGNERVPHVFISAYDCLMELVEKYDIQYAFFETIDTIDSVILAAMAKVGIIKQTFERGFLSIGGEFRMRLCSEQTKISP
ncbi:hypothetical protein ADUPG1_001164, partial [Aduncisulcus paluster]